jgi:polysaccharide pyruvyl transferase WcaK-like protein
VHDISGADMVVAGEISERLNGSVQVRQIDDPLEPKSVIGTALAVSGSRYHALVAALSKGVPVIVLGWPHKYDKLLRKIGFATYLAPRRDKELLTARVRDLCNSSINLALRDAIVRHLNTIEAGNQRMWRMAGSVLRDRMAVLETSTQ